MSTLIQRNIHLDGLRGVAILMVVIVHCYYRGPSIGEDTAIQKIISNLAILGWSGVDLFFSLSGYLITRILLSERETKSFKTYIGHFYVRRILRIFPLYYTFIIFAFLSSFLVLSTKIDPVLSSLRENITYYLLYLQNWFDLIGLDTTDDKKAFGHFWSLAIEEQYYLIWPLAVFLIRPKILCFICFVFITLSPVIRYLLLSHGWSSDAIYHSSLTHIDSIIMGSAIALMLSGSSKRFLNLFVSSLFTIGVFGLCVILILSNSSHYSEPNMQIYGYTFIALIYSSIVHFTAYGMLFKQALTTSWLVSMGKYSYFIYLFHWPLLLFTSHINMGYGYIFALYYIIVIVIICYWCGFLSYRFLESPILGFKERLKVVTV